MNIKQLILTPFLVFTMFLTGCAVNAPVFQPDFELVNKMKDANLPGMSSGEFKPANPGVETVTIRGSTLSSPYANSFALYLKAALDEQLKQAAVWDPKSSIKISGTLNKNDFDGSGINVGEADLAANFSVTRDGNEIHNKDYAIHHEWESAFIGAVAIPRAVENYAVAVQKLLDALFADQEFIRAISK